MKIFIIIIILFFLFIIIVNTSTNKETFVNIDDINKINIDKLRTQLIVNKFENKNTCCQGYKTLSNNCKFNFDSDENNCCN